MSEVVLDLETQKLFKDIERDKVYQLKVSVVGVYDYASDAYRTFEEGEIKDLEPLLTSASRVIGFNIRRFDLPVLQPYLFSSIDRLPVLDILEEVSKGLGHRASLQSIAQATLGRGKSGSGLDAVKLFNEGRMEELKRYCLDDVRLTKEIYEYGLKHGKVFFFSDRVGKTFEVPVQWQDKRSSEPAGGFPQSLF